VANTGLPAIDDVVYSAGLSLAGLVDYMHARDAHFGLAQADPVLLETLKTYGVLGQFDQDKIYPTMLDVFPRTAPSRQFSEYRPDIAVVDVRTPPTFTGDGLRAAVEARRA